MRPVTIAIGLALALLAAIGLVLGLHIRRSRVLAEAPLTPSMSAHRPALALAGCAADPGACRFPGVTTTGVPKGMALKAVPGQVSSGPGWSYNAGRHLVEVSGKGTVLSGLSIPCSVEITASNVTIKDDKVITSGNFGISLQRTTDVTIENSTISGLNATTGRIGSAIDDVYGDSAGLVIRGNNISAFKSAVQVSTGLVTGNYIHDPGYIAGDHTNGVIANGGTGRLTIIHNTILNDLSQTDAITLDTMTVMGPVANKTIEDNLLGGGSYPIYGGSAFGHHSFNIVIKDNQFSRVYYPESGRFGPIAYFSPYERGNIWAGNTWDIRRRQHGIDLFHYRAGSR